MLKIKNVCKQFGNTTILNNIKLNVKKNQIVGLVGPSGSGKSTLLRCIQWLEEIDSGTIKCNGKVGFVFQDFQLFSHMTVLQNLIYAPKLQDPSKNHVASSTAILAKLGLSGKENQ